MISLPIGSMILDVDVGWPVVSDRLVLDFYGYDDKIVVTKNVFHGSWEHEIE